MSRLTLGLAGAAVLAASFACNGYAAESDALQAAQARAEIQALMWRYVRALDSLNADAYAAAFTEDGQFGVGPSAEKGRAELKKMIMGLKERRAEQQKAGKAAPPPMYHIITNPYIELVDSDHARFHGYWLTVFGPAGEKGTPRVAAAGREVDELVRVDGKWLIKLRNVALKD